MYNIIYIYIYIQMHKRCKCQIDVCICFYTSKCTQTLFSIVCLPFLWDHWFPFFRYDVSWQFWMDNDGTGRGIVSPKSSSLVAPSAAVNGRKVPQLAVGRLIRWIWPVLSCLKDVKSIISRNWICKLYDWLLVSRCFKYVFVCFPCETMIQPLLGIQFFPVQKVLLRRPAPRQNRIQWEGKIRSLATAVSKMTWMTWGQTQKSIRFFDFEKGNIYTHQKHVNDIQFTPIKIQKMDLVSSVQWFDLIQSDYFPPHFRLSGTWL